MAALAGSLRMDKTLARISIGAGTLALAGFILWCLGRGTPIRSRPATPRGARSASAPGPSFYHLRMSHALRAGSFLTKRSSNPLAPPSCAPLFPSCAPRSPIFEPPTPQHAEVVRRLAGRE